MKNISSYFKSIFFLILNFLVFSLCLYLSIIFFLILLSNEAIKGRENQLLKEEFTSIVQKIADLSEGLLPSTDKKEMDLSGKLF